MSNTTIVFIKELTDLGDLPGDIPPELKLGWETLPDDLQQLLKADLIEQGFFKESSFSFVGIYYCFAAQTAVIGFPKYLTAASASQILNHVSLICRVAARAVPESALNFNDQFHPSHSQCALHISNPYDLAVFFLRDYAENGLYTERMRQIRADGVGQRSWTQTMRHTKPVFDRVPIYLRPIAVKSTKKPSGILTPLHAYVVNQCAGLLQPLGLFENLTLPDGPDLKKIDLSHYIPIISSKMSQTFSDRESRLLRALRSWCGEGPYNQTRLGVTSFEHLWEYATKEYFGNIRNTRSSPPKYYLDGSSTACIGGGEAIPDILNAGVNSSKGPFLAIFDAKYYCPIFDPQACRVYAAPPNSDIAKQIQYYYSLKGQYPSAQMSNAFLMPAPLGPKMYRYIGYAVPNTDWHEDIALKLSLPNVPAGSSAADCVMIYQVDPEQLFYACLNNVHISAEDVFTDFIQMFNKKN